MLQMDSQFNTLIQSYHDNLMQYKTTGDSKFKRSYEAAEEGLKNILISMSNDNESQCKQLKELNNPPEQHHDLAEERDLKIAAQKRQDQLTSIPSMPSMTYQYVGIGVLGALAIGLLFV